MRTAKHRPAVVVALALSLVASRAAARECERVPLHQLLDASQQPGGVVILSDGRELKASTHTVGGCETLYQEKTGIRVAATTDYTLMSHRTDRCVTGEGADAAYTGFQAITVTANGFRFKTDFVMEDIDSTRGFRKTMTSLGVAGGVLVRPRLELAPAAVVSVREFGMPAASLAAVGFPAAQDVRIEGVALNTTEPQNLPQRRDPTGKFKATVHYDTPVDKLVIIYAVTWQSSPSNSAATLVTGVSFPCGCPCRAKAAAARMVVPVPGGAPGTCTTKAHAGTAHGCSYAGDQWCDAVEGERWMLTGGAGGACRAVPSVFHVPVSPYSPAKAFG